MLFKKYSGFCLLPIALLGSSATAAEAKSNEIINERSGSTLIRSDYKPGEITKLCQTAIDRMKGNLDQIVALPANERTRATTLLAFEKAAADFGDTVSPLTFMGYISKDETISKEASDCESSIGQFSASIFTRKDLYQALVSVPTPKVESTADARLYKEITETFEENGMKLPDDRLLKLRSLREELAQTESQFSANLNQEKSTVEFTKSELEGLPEDFLQGVERTSDGKYIITTKEPHYIRVMENASNGETRRKMLNAYENRAAKINTPLLEKAIHLRQQIATLLGYSTWADYRTHRRMAKDAATVSTFLNGLRGKLAQRNKEDLNRLLALKKEVEPESTQLKAWDIRYYSNLLKKKAYSLDEEKVREYFPAELVIEGLFKTYSTLLGVDYVEKKDATTWAEKVHLYEIHDRKSKKLIGYFFTDFYPRPGKYGHAAAFTLISGRDLENGQYSLPVSAIVANLSAPENGKPALLKHDEVTTVFHEFGHIMHQTLTRAPYASLSGSSVDQDFVEAPSQMLENWTYSPTILQLLSGHYKDRSKKLPQDLLNKLVELRDFNQGYFYTRQLLFGLLDMAYHTASGPVDTTAVYQQSFRDIVGLEPVEGTHFQASFGHLMGGYDAGYYGYLWSKVYAEDMFTRFEKEGLLNPRVGQRYRKFILESGKMRDGSVLLEKFLGRKPNSEAFYKMLHISG